MQIVALIICIANVVFCGWRCLRALQSGRLIALVWTLVTYHAIFLVGMVMSGGFSKYRGFTNDFVTVSDESILYVGVFVLTFNVILSVAELFVWSAGGVSARSEAQWFIEREPNWLRAAQWIYFALLLGSSVLYWAKMQGIGYREYVEFRASNWPQVFFWASAPLITILALRRRHLLAIVACSPFLFFAYYLKVRAFALLSLVPALVIIYFQMLGAISARRTRIFRPIAVGAVIFGVLLVTSIVVTYFKAANIAGASNIPGQITGLPDAGMIYGTAIVFEYVRETQIQLGLDGIAQYMLNLINPFMRLFNIKPPFLQDPAVYMAYIVDGVPLNNFVFFHYPTLWYADAFLTFGIAGLWLAALWGLVLSLWERVMTRNSVLLGLLLPYYTWHAYMLVRGTPTSASVPLTYAAYVALLVILLVAPLQLLRRIRRRGSIAYR